MIPVRQSMDHVVWPMLEVGRVPRDAVLIVHSAFAELGRRGHRAETFIDSLLSYLDRGTLLMPTMTWRTVTPEHPIFDEMETPSHTGILSEVFRTGYSTARSLHPTHSVAGRGDEAEYLLSSHHLDDTPCGNNSPYGKMLESKAHVLMLGLGLENCTAIHLPEEMVAPDIYLRPKEEAEEYQLRDRHGNVFAMRLRRHARLDRDFLQFTAPLKSKGVLLEGDIAGTFWQTVEVKVLVDYLFGVLTKCPEGTLAMTVDS